MCNNIGSIELDDVVKKKARAAVDDSDLREIQEIGRNHVLIQKGILQKGEVLHSQMPRIRWQYTMGSTYPKARLKDGCAEWLHTKTNIPSLGLRNCQATQRQAHWKWPWLGLRGGDA
jgi:hypothetical protein